MAVLEHQGMGKSALFFLKVLARTVIQRRQAKDDAKDNVKWLRGDVLLSCLGPKRLSEELCSTTSAAHKSEGIYILEPANLWS